MRPRALLVALGFIGGSAACVDLFHATTFETLCDVDAAACDAGLDVASPAPPPVDFCAWSVAEATARARAACARFGACAGPLGETTFGACMLRLQLAYDCKANPTLRPRGAAEALARCLATADACADVDRCLLGDTAKPACVPVASGAFRACAPGSSLRVECASRIEAEGAEPCALAGRACARLDDSEAACVGARGTECNASGCQGTSLVECRTESGKSIDVGLDCASFGDGRCVSTRETNDAGASACAPDPVAETCIAPAVPTCRGSRIEHCVEGRLVTVDCAALGLGCDARARTLGPWNLVSACTAAPVACMEPDERCVAGNVLSCARGRLYELDCAREGLGPCAFNGGGRAACARRGRE